MRYGFLSRLFGSEDAAQAQIAELALAAGGMGAWELDLRTGLVRGTGELRDYFGFDERLDAYPLDGFFDAMHPDDAPRVRAELAAAMDASEGLEARYRIRLPDRPLRWVGVAAQVTLRDDDGAAAVMTGIIWDETEGVRREAELRRMSDEIDHRVKNAFATIRALVNLGARAEADTGSFASTLRAQVQALADMHEITVRSAARGAERITLGEVVAQARAAWNLDPPELDDRTARAALVPRRASAIAMILYQLAADAARHAPGAAPPRVRLAMHRDDGHAVLTWDGEADGLLPHEEPKAFGPLLLRQCASTLGGELESERRPGAIQVSLRFPVDA